MRTPSRQPSRRRLLTHGALPISVFALVVTACGGSSDPAADEREEVVLRLATTQTRDAPENLGVWRLEEILEEEAPWITIQYVGGPEAIAPFDAAENVSTGAIHLANVSSAYYTQLVPEAEVYDLTPNPPHLDRESGAHDVINTWHEPAGLYVLGGTTAEFSHMLHFGERYTELDIEDLDLSGWLMRGNPVTQPIIEDLGGSVVTLPVGEIYTAMERGTINGFSAGNIGMYALGIAEPIEASLMVELLAVRYPMLFHLQTWESLDEETQEALTSAMIQVEQELPQIFGELVQEEYDQRAADGKVALEPSQEAAEALQQRARDVSWDLLVDRLPHTSEVRDLYENR